MACKRLNADTVTWPLAALALMAGLAACHESGGVAPPAQVMEQTGEATSPAGRQETKQVNDALITTKVKTALLRDPQASGFQISVNTYRGIVQLSGFVDTVDQKQRAGELAKGIEGVRTVHNDLIVTSKADFTSSDIEKTGGVGVIVRF